VKGIDVLPDDVLLTIFDFNAVMSLCCYGGSRGIEAWQSLVHVCRRWRSLGFESPRRLNLQLLCTPQTPIKDALDVWPALPLTVWGDNRDMALSGTDNIIAALEQSNRVRDLPHWGSKIGRNLGRDAGAIPRVDASTALVTCAS
jgi:hypothetical protein